ncbi:MAG: four helix bundle protein [Candidatus Cloacimonetes bacterium]|nr:four helix bundle protein [Candidatus Cloacimonadota bacterium]
MQEKNTKVDRPGYEYLVVYMLGKVIQDLTVEFCKHWIKSIKLRDQMEGAARSNPQNIAEGSTQPSLKGYIKLSGIAHGSNEELTKDFEDFLRQRGLPIWDKNHLKIREFREFRVVWTGQNSLNTPELPNDSVEAANMLLTFCNQEGYLLRKHVESLKRKHETEGGLTERLYRRRREYRGF